MTRLTIIILLALTTAASAEQRTFYDATGRSVGKSSTDSQGTTTFYDAAGRPTGRAQTDSQGTTTVYDPTGRNIGRTTDPTKRTR